MKRKLLVAFTLSLLILMLCAGAQAKTRIDGGNCGVVDETHDGSNVKWNVYDDGSLVVSGHGEMKEFPEFYDREDLHESVTYVAIGDFVTNVGSFAFADFANLEEVYLASTVTVVDYDAFRGCEKLHTINLSHLTTIGDFAFDDCDALKSITLPDTVTSIGDYAFADCDALKSITLPDSETSIGDGLFMGCKALESVTIPESITEIAESMFEDCTNLKTVNLPDSLKSISGDAFRDCTSLESIVIPDGVTKIGYWAFYGCTSLENVKLPAGLTWIQGCAFRKCISLKSITIPSKVTLVEEYVFEDCTSLESVVFPSGVKEIFEGCFKGCSSLKDVTLPADLTIIHKFAFENTTALTQLTIPSGLDSIYVYAFSKSGLKFFICTPNSVGYETAKEYCTYTDKNCRVYFGFGKCGDDMSWKLLENGTLSLSGSGAMYDYDSDGILAPWYNLKNYISKIQFSLNSETNNPEITHIGSYAFYRLSGVTEVYLPKSLQSIGEACFSECSGLNSGLKHVNFGNPSLEAIPKSAFFRCYALESINLPKSCPVIEDYAFSQCSALKSLRLPEDLKTIGTCAFFGCAYLTDLKLTDVKSIGAYAFAYCYDLESVELPEMVISIAADAFTGTQPTFVCYKYSAPYQHAKANGFPVDYLAALALPEDIKTVESSAFMGSDAGIIIIPEGCESIGSSAFSNCDNLYKVVILGSETTIERGAFLGTRGFVIYAPAGSCAESFASANTIPFDAL